MPKILAIDDRKDNLVALTALLANLMPGCEVMTALSGPEGVEKARTGQPDVILLDVQMPGMDGFETCRRLMADESTRSIPVVMITAIRTDSKSRVSGLEIGANAYLAKPIDSVELVSQVKVALRIKAAEDALRQQRDLLEQMVEERTRELRESEEKYRALVEDAPHLICRFEPDNTLTFVNRAYARCFGKEPEEFVGGNWLDLVPVEERPEIVARLAAVRPEEPMQTYEHRIIAHCGDRRWQRWTDRAFFDDKGALLFVQSIGEDITDQKEAEAKIRESEETYRNLFQNAQVGLYRTRISDGKILESNEQLARMFGYDSREEFIAEYVTSLNYVDPGTRERMLQEIRKNGVVKNFEVRFYRKDRSVVWVRYSAKIYPEKGWIEGIAEDITDRKNAETEKEKLQDQLMQAQKLESIGRLAGGVAHDFNNKLTVILGYAQMTMEGLERADAQYENLQQVMKAGKQSVQIVNQLLAFARKQIISPEVLDLNETVDDMLKMLHRIIGEDIDLVWLPGHGLWRIKMDPVQVDQILANLCVNAKDAISGVGRVSIETRNELLNEAYCAGHPGAVPGEFVTLGISDNGCGMDGETLKNIFEPFFTTKEVGKGTGLGLSTVYGIVKQNNGFIEVESDPGRGTTVAVYLPRAGGEAEEEKGEDTGEIPKGQGETILLVEDEAGLLEMGRIMLERFGYRVVTANTPDEAISLAERHGEDIHLLMTDVVMPQMNGQELARRLRELRPDLKCLFMSGYTSDIIANRGKLNKGVHFIQKPFMLKDLAVKVREAMDSEE